MKTRKEMTMTVEAALTFGHEDICTYWLRDLESGILFVWNTNGIKKWMQDGQTLKVRGTVDGSKISRVTLA